MREKSHREIRQAGVSGVTWGGVGGRGGGLARGIHSVGERVYLEEGHRLSYVRLWPEVDGDRGERSGWWQVRTADMLGSGLAEYQCLAPALGQWEPGVHGDLFQSSLSCQCDRVGCWTKKQLDLHLCCFHPILLG